MPEKLTQFQLDNFKGLLSRRMAIVRAHLDDLSVSVAIEDGDNLTKANHQAGAEASGQHSATAIDTSRHFAEIKDIEAALARIADQQFGICLDCKEPMAFKRLLLYPTAKRCPACQRLYEIVQMKAPHP